MPQAFGSILGALGTFGKGLGGITSALGPVMSLAGLVNQYSLAGKEKAALDRSLYYSKHPEAIANLEKSFERPLETGLVKGTENIVNASLAEQGLSQAPGIQSQVLAQALAPYQQNEQRFALEEAFKAIGLPIEALSAVQSTQHPNDLAAMLKSILPGAKDPAAGGGFTFPAGTVSDLGGYTGPGITAGGDSGGGDSTGLF